MGVVLSSLRPLTSIAPLVSVEHVFLCMYISYKRIGPCVPYLNPDVYTVLGDTEEFAIYFLKVVK